MIKFHTIINEDKWTVEVLSPTRYSDEIGDDSFGIMDDDSKTITFNASNLNRSIVKHEVHHAYWSYLCLDDCDSFTTDQIAEITAMFAEKHSDKVRKKALEIYKCITKG